MSFSFLFNGEKCLGSIGTDSFLPKGTLCEALLMVEAYRVNVICPNKHTTSTFQHWKGHLLESETYVGGMSAFELQFGRFLGADSKNQVSSKLFNRAFIDRTSR